MSPEWMDLAACRGSNPDMFVLEAALDRRGRSVDKLAHARAICASCPVHDDCRDYAISGAVPADDVGIWAGMTRGQRLHLRRRLGLTQPRPAPHGTRACYKRGCRRAECVEANRVYVTSQRAS